MSWFFPRPRVALIVHRFARIATTQRREARTILRHTRPSDTGPAVTFARRQARELLDQADACDISEAVWPG